MINVAGIVERELERSPLVVLSACAGVTNGLVCASEALARGRVDEARTEIAAITQRHLGMAEELRLDNVQELAAMLTLLEREVDEAAGVRGSALRLMDRLASYGERLSSLIFASLLRQRGVDVRLLDATHIIITDDQHTSAVPQMDQVSARAKERCRPLLAPGRAVVTQGFIGATIDGTPTTIGCGGSDYSAAIFGAVLGADEMQIWTDVDGVLTADPTIVSDARRILSLTFREAAELAYFGARVLHPKTILPAIEKGIPVRVLNALRPDGNGTLIADSLPLVAECIVKSIAYKKGITVVNIESTRMLMAYGFLARVFEVFDRYKKAVDVIATSEIGISLTVDDPSNLDAICTELRGFADVEVLTDRAVLCVVGEKMKFTKGVAAKVFSALDRCGLNVELISHGGSEINLTLVIRQEEIPQAVQALHREFFSRVNVAEGVFE